MNVMDYIKGRRTKSDIIPGTGTLSDERCPLCDRQMHQMKPCCSSKHWTMECRPCGYKRILEDAP